MKFFAKILCYISILQALFQSAQHIYEKREGSGAGRPKNMRILRIRFRNRIPNTGADNKNCSVFCVRMLVPESTAVVLRDREASSAGQGIPTGSEAATWDTQEARQHKCSGSESYWATRIRMRNYLS
jgi:hypothetical protein